MSGDIPSFFGHIGAIGIGRRNGMARRTLHAAAVGCDVNGVGITPKWVEAQRSMPTTFVANAPRFLGPRHKVRPPARHRAQPEIPWRCGPTSSSNRRARLIRPTVGRSGISSLCQRLDRPPWDRPGRPAASALGAACMASRARQRKPVSG